MEESTEYLPQPAPPVRDLDVLHDGSWAAVAGEGDSQVVLFDGHSVGLPRPYSSPLIRRIGFDRAVVVDTRVGGTETNAWIVSATGEAIASFYAGDAVHDIVIVGERLVVTYFDEAFSNSLSGIVLFSTTGELIHRFHEVHGYEPSIIDCYAATRGSGNRVLCLTYPDFPLVEWDTEVNHVKTWTVPEAVYGSSALSYHRGTLVFHGPYQEHTALYAWKPGADRAEKIGTYPGPLRGLAAGRFLAAGTAGYTIISL